jgi:hypothetical protein
MGEILLLLLLAVQERSRGDNYFRTLALISI